jgi:hypothetical protein
MAIQPLIVQRPSVSLIGGKELPKASGEGIRVPDISDSFSQLAARLEQKAKANNEIIDKVEGQRLAEAQWTGKDGDAFRRLTVPDASREKQAAFVNTMEENAISDLALRANAQFTEIGARTDIDTPHKVALYNAAAEGYLQSLDPYYRAAARRWLSSEIQNRQNFHVADDLAKNQQIALEGIKTRVRTNSDAAISAGIAGANPDSYLAAVAKAQDELVELRVIDQPTADNLKLETMRLIKAASVQGRVANEAMHGNVDIDQLEDFAMSLKAGGSAKLKMDDFYEISNFNVERGREGEYKSHELLDSDQLRQAFGKQETTEGVANQLLQVANLLQQKRAGYIDEKRLYETINTLPNDTRMPRSLDPIYNKVVERMVQAGIVDDPQGLQTLTKLVWHTKVMPTALLDTIKLGVFSNDVARAQSMLQLWNTIANVEIGGGQIGTMIRYSVPGDAQAALDAATDAMTEIMRKGGDAKASGDEWQRFIKRAQDPAYTVDKSKEGYYAATKAGWGTGTPFDDAMRSRFMDEYGMNSLDPQWAEEFTKAYHTSMVLTENPDPLAVFDATFERLKNRWSAGEIYEGGIEKAGPLDNPTYYGKRFNPTDPTSWTGTHKYQWINDYVHYEVNKLLEQGVLDLQPEERRYIEDVFGSGNPRFLGEHMVLQATGANRDQPQFNIILKMPDGSTPVLRVRRPDGSTIPLLIDPGAVRAHLNSKAQVAAEIKKQENEVENLRTQMIQDQYTANWNRNELQGKTLLPGDTLQPLNDDEFTQWFIQQPEDWQKNFTSKMSEYRDGLEKSIQRLNDTVVKLPKGVDIGPTELIQSRAAGEDVVVAAAARINSVLPDPTNGQFLVNIASAESRFGTADGTFRLSGDRGIWQINDGPSGAFAEIQRQAAIPGTRVALANERLKTIGIDVASMTTQDLEKPLYSAAVARLYMMLNPGREPVTVAEQAQAWKEHYNTYEGAGTLDHFIAAADKVLMPAQAYASTGLEAGGPGSVTDMQGNVYPANFTATRPATQLAVLNLSAAFGQPLRITPHGGTQPDARHATSQHHAGTAVDIYVEDYDDATRARLISTAIAMGFRGIGGYAAGDGRGTIHLDLRGGGRGPGGLATWWRNRPGVDGPWTAGPRWFTDGINNGLTMRTSRGV